MDAQTTPGELARISVRTDIDPTLYAAVRRAAAAEDRSVAAVTRRLLRSYVDAQQRREET